MGPAASLVFSARRACCTARGNSARSLLLDKSRNVRSTWSMPGTPLVLQGRSFMPSSLQPYHTGPCVLAPRHEETEAQKGMGTCLGSHTSQWKHPDSNRGHPAPGSAFSTRVSQELTVTDTHVHTHTYAHPFPKVLTASAQCGIFPITWDSFLLCLLFCLSPPTQQSTP